MLFMLTGVEVREDKDMYITSGESTLILSCCDPTVCAESMINSYLLLNSSSETKVLVAVRCNAKTKKRHDGTNNRYNPHPLNLMNDESLMV